MGVPKVTPGTFGNSGSDNSTVQPFPRGFIPLMKSPFNGTSRSYSVTNTSPGANSLTWTVNTVSSATRRSEEHTSELQSRGHLVCRLLLEKTNNYGKFQNRNMHYT